jgi:DNA-binding GntR family transcriptional regulator
VVATRHARSGAYHGYRSVRQIVQDKLTREIHSGRLGPGQKLVEATLAEQYGVSRGPVREAIRALEGQQMVKVLPNRGAVVTSLSVADLQEIYDLLVELERLALTAVPSPIADEQLVPMERLVERMGRSLGDADAWLALNDEFHLTLYRASGRERICRLIADLLSTLRPYSRQYLRLPDRLVEANEEHQPILDAARSGQSGVLQSLTRQHRLQAAAVMVNEIRGIEAGLARVTADAVIADVGAGVVSAGQAPPRRGSRA